MIKDIKNIGRGINSNRIGLDMVRASVPPAYNFKKRIMKEIWKDIENFEGLYQASSFGNVRSVRKNIIKKPFITDRGYRMVGLNKDKLYTRRIARLIALTFIPNTENKPCVNHINGIKDDDRVENLEWVTISENEFHSYRVLGKIAHRQGKRNLPEFGCIEICQYDKEGKLLNTYPSIAEASRQLNVSASSITGVLKGRFYTIKGTIFKYK